MARELIQVPPEKMTSQIRNRKQPTERALRVLNPRGEGQEEIQERIERNNPRMKYTAMRAHQEMAAQALAVGATQKMAAIYAGVSQRQIKKYYGDPDFRSRIEELRAVLASRIKGRIMNELNRRVTGKKIQRMDTLEMLRILDRMTTGGKGMAINVQGDVNVNNYERVLNALFGVDPGSDGVDFPQFGDPSSALPGGSS